VVLDGRFVLELENLSVVVGGIFPVPEERTVDVDVSEFPLVKVSGDATGVHVVMVMYTTPLSTGFRMVTVVHWIALRACVTVMGDVKVASSFLNGDGYAQQKLKNGKQKMKTKRQGLGVARNIFIFGIKGREVDRVQEACSSCLDDRGQRGGRKKGMERRPGHT